LVRLIFNRDVTQVPTPTADGEPGDLAVSAGDVADDAVPGAC
jgi:hypothetical protein